VSKTAISLKEVSVGCIEHAYSMGPCFSKVARDSRFADVATRTGEIGVGYKAPHSAVGSRLIAEIHNMYDQMKIVLPQAMSEQLRHETRVPLLSFWRWWLEWATTLWDLGMEDKPDDMPVSDEILELIFRSAPEAMDATTVARVLGVSGNRDALINLGLWLRLLSTDEQGPPEVAGQVTAFGEQMMREIFRSAWARDLLSWTLTVWLMCLNVPTLVMSRSFFTASRRRS
jgi:hypothetical protein